MKGIRALYLSVFFLFGCQSPVKPINSSPVIFKTSYDIPEYNLKKAGKGFPNSYLARTKNRDHLILVNENKLIERLDLDSLFSEFKGHEFNEGYDYYNESIFIKTNEDHSILEYQIKSENCLSHQLLLDSIYTTYSYYSETPFVFMGDKLVIPLSLSSGKYLRNPDLLKLKFQLPQAAVISTDSFKVEGFIGKHPPKLQTHYFMDEFHFQEGYKNNGLLLANFLNDSIFIYNQNLEPIKVITGKSRYEEEMKPISIPDYYDSKLASEYQMSRFRYGDLQYSEPDNLIIRTCLLPDTTVQDGLLKNLLSQNFSLQFFKNGKLVSEYPFIDHPYSQGSVILENGKIYIFYLNENSSNELRYDVYRVSDFL